MDGLDQIDIGKDGKGLAEVNSGVNDVSGFLLNAEIDDNLQCSLYFVNGECTYVFYLLPSMHL